MHPPSASSGRPCTPGSTTQSSSPHTTHRSTVVSSARVAPCMGSRCREGNSPVRSSLLARSGESIRRGCPMSAAGFASRYVTTTRVRTLRRARASCSRPRPRDGTASDSHAAARADTTGHPTPPRLGNNLMRQQVSLGCKISESRWPGILSVADQPGSGLRQNRSS